MKLITKILESELPKETKEKAVGDLQRMHDDECYRKKVAYNNGWFIWVKSDLGYDFWSRLAAIISCLLLTVGVYAQALVKHPGVTYDRYEVVGAPDGVDYIWTQSLDGNTFVWDTSFPYKIMRKGGVVTVQAWKVTYNEQANRATRIRLLFTLIYNSNYASERNLASVVSKR